MYMTQENPNWNLDNSFVELVIHFGGKKFSMPLCDLEESSYLSSSFHHFVNQDSIILSWGVKDFFSFLKGKTGILPENHNNIYDLKIISSYFGYSKNRPSSFKEALSILKLAHAEPRWKEFKKLYDFIYKPLFSEVIPSMETFCLVDNEKRKCVYPFYQIEGQLNGRLKAIKNGNSSYNPHSLDFEERKNIRPSNYDDSFVYFDFRNMEVCVLGWLSGDENLNAVLDSSIDPYKEIWKRMTGVDPTDVQRSICKKMFLPVVFGLGKFSLSKKIGISEKIAGMIIDNFVKFFPKAFEWVEKQSDLSDGIAFDFFGRRRVFDSNEFYKARNFSIQSPASIVCLMKLVRLFNSISEIANLCFHVHDGYCLVCKKSMVEEVSEIGIDCLESDEDLFPSLKLKTICKFGFDLNNLKTIKRKVQFS